MSINYYLSFCLIIFNICIADLINSEATPITFHPINSQNSQSDSSFLRANNNNNNLELTRSKRNSETSDHQQQRQRQQHKSDSANNEEIGDAAELLNLQGITNVNKDSKLISNIKSASSSKSNGLEDYPTELQETNDISSVPPKRSLNGFGMTPMHRDQYEYQQQQQYNNGEPFPIQSPFGMHSVSSSEGEEQQEMKKRFYANRIIPFFSWEPNKLEHGKETFFKISNHPNGLKSLYSSTPFATNKMYWLPPPSAPSSTNTLGNYNSQGTSSSSSTTTGDDNDSIEKSSHIGGSPFLIKSPLHDSLENYPLQWNFKHLHPLLTSHDSAIATTSAAEASAQKRNANYMCHFKLCQIGASGKRKWNPTQWFFGQPPAEDGYGRFS